MTTARTLLLAAGAALALAATGAHAHGDDGHGRGKGWGHYKHDRDWHDAGRYRSYAGPTVIRERIIVRDEPVYIASPRYYERPSYAYRREPAIVIGVDIPPLVIPLR